MTVERHAASPQKRDTRPRPRGTLAPRGPSRPIRARAWTIGRIVLVGGGLVATYGLFFLTAAQVASRARETRVPDVRGRSIADATLALSRAGLELRVDAVRRADAAIPADHVLSQQPDAGTVLRRNRIVRVRVSDGQRDPEVPSVVGQHERTAELTLTESRIAIGSRAEIRSPDFESGLVVAQSPPPAGRASTVALLINRQKPETSYVMPDLIGTPAARVTDILRARGFRVNPGVPVPYPNLPPGIVVKQTPDPGFRLTTNDAITLEVTR
jgi:serine/threonine-protein kinase